jgi:hypothetical protein
MSSHDPTGTDWTGQEVDLIVADYFEMLRMEISRQDYIKAQRNAELQKLTGRSHGSIEFKHQNISAVLLKLGMPWIPGYKPMKNYQNALIDGIGRHLAAKGEPLVVSKPLPIQIADDSALYVGPAPALQQIQDDEPAALKRLVRKFDPAARDERNRVLGRRGEERVLWSEKVRLRLAGRSDLAENVRHVSLEDGDGAGYDILSFTERGEKRLLEVKTTTGYEHTPFYLSANEYALSEECPNNFRIFRLYDFAREPKAFKITPPLKSALILETANYRASFG